MRITAKDTHEGLCFTVWAAALVVSTTPAQRIVSGVAALACLAVLLISFRAHAIEDCENSMSKNVSNADLAAVLAYVRRMDDHIEAGRIDGYSAVKEELREFLRAM